MNLIWILLPFGICLAALLLSAVQSGAFAGGRLARSWAVKMAPHALVLSLAALLWAPKPPPVVAAALGYVGLALIGIGWSLRGRLSAAVQAGGFFVLAGSQFWIQWAREGAEAAIHTGVIATILACAVAAIFGFAAWYERHEQARTGEGA
jgi:hypothetical protein